MIGSNLSFSLANDIQKIESKKDLYCVIFFNELAPSKLIILFTSHFKDVNQTDIHRTIHKIRVGQVKSKSEKFF